MVFAAGTGAAGPPLEPNLNGCADDAAVTKKPCDTVGFAACAFEPNWKGAGDGEAALATAAFESLALNMGNAGDAAVVAAAVPKHGVGAIEGVVEIGLLPPSDGPEKTKPPAGFVALEAGAVTAEDAVGVGTASADVCGNKSDDAAKPVEVADDCDTAGEAAVVASVAFGEVNFAKAANSGFVAVEAAAVGSDAGALSATASDAVVLAAPVAFELKKPAPN